MHFGLCFKPKVWHCFKPKAAHLFPLQTHFALNLLNVWFTISFFLDRLLFSYCYMLFLLFDFLHCLYYLLCLHGAILLCNSEILFRQIRIYLLHSHEIGYFRKNNTFLVQFIDDCNGLVELVSNSQRRTCEISQEIQLTLHLRKPIAHC